MSDENAREELISAFLDGEASADDAKAVHANARLRAQAERWRANDTAMRAAFDPLAETPIDDALLAQMGLAAPSVPSAPTPANDNPPWRRWILPAGAVAAGVAALLTLLPSSPSTDLDRALDTTPSGEVAMVDGARLQPVLTVRAGDGRWCREYAYRSNRDLACRSEDRWLLEARMRDTASNPGAIGMAGGETGDAIDKAYDKLKASDALGRAQERAAIAAGWRPAANTQVN